MSNTNIKLFVIFDRLCHPGVEGNGAKDIIYILRRYAPQNDKLLSSLIQMFSGPQMSSGPRSPTGEGYKPRFGEVSKNFINQIIKGKIRVGSQKSS